MESRTLKNGYFYACFFVGMLVFISYVSLVDHFYLWVADPLYENRPRDYSHGGVWSGLRITSSGFFYFHQPFLDVFEYEKSNDELLLLLDFVVVDGLTAVAWGWLALYFSKHMLNSSNTCATGFKRVLIRAAGLVVGVLAAGLACLFLSLWIPRQSGSVYRQEMKNSLLKLNKTGEFLQSIKIIPLEGG